MTPGEAKDAGLVCDVVSPEALIQSCLDIARTFTAENRQSIGFAKKAICRGMNVCDVCRRITVPLCLASNFLFRSPKKKKKNLLLTP